MKNFINSILRNWDSVDLAAVCKKKFDHPWDYLYHLLFGIKPRGGPGSMCYIKRILKDNIG